MYSGNSPLKKVFGLCSQGKQRAKRANNATLTTPKDNFKERIQSMTKYN